jgi:Ca2+-binding EF-hand superfamily protein
MEAAQKKKYARDGENPHPWQVASLSLPKTVQGLKLKAMSGSPEEHIEPWEKHFYPASKFSVKNYLFSKGVSLDFPDYLHMSRNYYEPSWGMKTHRRLKNVIVTMDFVPSKADLREVAAVGKAFTPAQEKNLKKAFSMADADQSGGISMAELKEVLKAVDVDVEGEEGDKFFQNYEFSGSGGTANITFEDVKQMLSQRMYYRIQAGRYYVALSLFEAECMRAVLHHQSGVPLVPGKLTTAALRTDRTLLDASTAYEPAQSFQDKTAFVSYRFIDSGTNYQPKEVSLLVRALQENDCERRKNFFLEVRSNRRRKQRDPSTTSLSKVFVTADEHHLLNYKIASGRITALLKSRGMYPRDAFAAFDRDRDGLLNYYDLKAGLEWLNLKLDQALLIGFMKEVDKDKDGYINLDEFKAAVGWEDDADMAGVPAFNGMVPLPPMPSDDRNGKPVEIPQAVLEGIKIKVKKLTKFSKVWTSQGSMSREKASVWDPEMQSGLFRANKTWVSLGHFAGHGYDNPNKDGKDRLGLEVTDTTGR